MKCETCGQSFEIEIGNKVSDPRRFRLGVVYLVSNSGVYVADFETGQKHVYAHECANRQLRRIHGRIRIDAYRRRF